MESRSQKGKSKPLKRRTKRLKPFLFYIFCHNFSKFSQIALGQIDTDIKQQQLYWLKKLFWTYSVKLSSEFGPVFKEYFDHT